MKRSVRRGGIALLAVAPVVVWLTSWKIDEARYSPFTLEYQKRQSLVVFTGEVPLYRSAWAPTSNEVLAYISQSKFVEPMPTDDPRWKMVHRFKTGHDGGWQRPFHSLHSKLVTWSERHPDVAPFLWQTGFNLVRSDAENEVVAGYELMGELYVHCNSVSDLKRLISILAEVHRIDVKRVVPAAVLAAKLEPPKSKMLAGKVSSQALVSRFSPSGDGKAPPKKSAPKSPKQSSKQSPKNSPPAK